MSTNSAPSIPASLRERLAAHLTDNASAVEQASTQRHLELLAGQEERMRNVQSVRQEHAEIVRRVAQELVAGPRNVDAYRAFGTESARRALQKNIGLREAIDGLIFLKSEMWHSLRQSGLLADLTVEQFHALADMMTERIDVLLSELAIAYHRYFTRELHRQLRWRKRRDEEKDLFIRVASHELRNPLNGASLLCELVDAKLQAQGDTEAQRHVSQIRHTLALIERHISQLLDLSMLDDARIRQAREPFDITALIEQTAESLRHTLTEHEIAVTPGPACTIESDRASVEQVLANLIQNAAKYSDAGTTIMLSHTVENGSVAVSVRDEGIGIAPEQVERIFRPYERLRAPGSSEEGLGLGLYISKTLLGALGGTITVASSPGEGSTFTVTLPRVSPLDDEAEDGEDDRAAPEERR